MNRDAELILQEFAQKIKLPNNSNVAAYTAITNDFDRLSDPEIVSEDIDYICFTTNDNLKSSIWNIVTVPFRYRDPRRLARLLKVLPHIFLKHYTISVWIDGNGIIIGDIKDLIDKYLIDEKLLCFKHPNFKDCIYGEAIRCIWSGKDNASKIIKQMKAYKSLNYPSHNGLIATGMLIRLHHDNEVKKNMEYWWREIDKYSVRDQLSFNYVAWKMNFKYKTLPFDLYNNEYIIWKIHQKAITYSDRLTNNLRSLIISILKFRATLRRLIT